MNKANTNAKIGHMIRELRDRLGFSQEMLAERLGISRSTISQIENGDRKVTAQELSELSEIFGVSADTILGLEREPEVILPDARKKKKPRNDLRINVPRKNLGKFKEVFLYILNKVGSKPNIGETVIYKLLYFIDFDFYEKYEEQLIGATYIKNRHGPTPVEFKKITDSMIEDGEIIKVRSKYFQYPQTKYLPRKEPELAKLRADELKIIDDVLDRLSDKNASQISAYAHGDVPWLTTEDGNMIEYESVFYRTAPYSVREYGEDVS